MDHDLTKHLRQFMHNDGSGFVAGYDKEGIDREFAHLQAKAAPKFETAEDLIAWLDTLHATEGNAITNQKWEPAQRAIVALRSASQQVPGGWQEFMTECHDFWAHYSIVNESEQDDMQDKRDAMIDRMTAMIAASPTAEKGEKG